MKPRPIFANLAVAFNLSAFCSTYFEISANETDLPSSRATYGRVPRSCRRRRLIRLRHATNRAAASVDPSASGVMRRPTHPRQSGSQAPAGRPCSPHPAPFRPGIGRVLEEDHLVFTKAKVLEPRPDINGPRWMIVQGRQSVQVNPPVNGRPGSGRARVAPWRGPSELLSLGPATTPVIRLLLGFALAGSTLPPRR